MPALTRLSRDYVRLAPTTDKHLVLERTRLTEEPALEWGISGAFDPTTAKSQSHLGGNCLRFRGISGAFALQNVLFVWGRLGDLNPGPTHYESGGNQSICPRIRRFLED
jgi:hypothetical protein